MSFPLCLETKEDSSSEEEDEEPNRNSKRRKVNNGEQSEKDKDQDKENEGESKAAESEDQELTGSGRECFDLLKQLKGQQVEGTSDWMVSSVGSFDAFRLGSATRHASPDLDIDDLKACVSGDLEDVSEAGNLE